MANATRSQLFALYSDTGKCLELRNLGDKLSLETAKDMISRMRDQGVASTVIHAELIALGATVNEASEPKRVKPKKETVLKHGGVTVKVDRRNFQNIYDEAHRAGMKAGEAVEFHGACGFASIKFAGTTAWARWTKSKKLCGTSYPSGRSIYVHEFGQSMMKKEAYASAFANVLTTHGIVCRAESRID